MNESVNQIVEVLSTGIKFNSPRDNLIKVYEEEFFERGISKQYLEWGIKKLKGEGVITRKEVMYAPHTPQSTYPIKANLSSTYDTLYNKVVYILHIDRAKLKAKNGEVKKYRSLKFVDNQAVIQAGNIKIKLPPHGNEHWLCKIMYKYKINEPVDWSEIYEAVTGNSLPDDKRKGKKMVYDAYEKLNERVESKTGIKGAFAWQNNTIKRTL
jgi:hypothetical protein